MIRTNVLNPLPIMLKGISQFRPKNSNTICYVGLITQYQDSRCTIVWRSSVARVIEAAAWDDSALALEAIHKRLRLAEQTEAKRAALEAIGDDQVQERIDAYYGS